jgi:hypothetical protein
MGLISSLHAFGVDDVVNPGPNPVPSMDHFSGALLGNFSRAPKPEEAGKRFLGERTVNSSAVVVSFMRYDVYTTPLEGLGSEGKI